MVLSILICAFIGFVTWLLITYVPMPKPIKTAIVVFSSVYIVIYLLQVLGIDILSSPILHRR